MPIQECHLIFRLLNIHISLKSQWIFRKNRRQEEMLDSAMSK